MEYHGYQNPFRKKLAQGKRMLGTHVNLYDSRICEMLGMIGFDYLWIDMEHIATTFHDMESGLIAARAANTPCIVRVTWNEIPYIKRVLEAGPAAIVVPMVNSVEEAQRAIDACIYPPEGKRGFGPCRARNYGLENLSSYLARTNSDVCRFIQVESRDAVEIMEETAKIPYLDGYVLGPVDLSASVGELGNDLHGAETNRLIDLAIRKAHDLGKPIGFSTGTNRPEELEHWISKGLDFISAGTDMQSVVCGGMELLSNMRRISDQYQRSMEA